MDKKKIDTNNAPKAIGPYSQAISIPSNQQLIFVSGQLPLDPKTGNMVQGDIQALTKRVLENIKAILTEAKSDFNHVVRVDVFLKNMQDFTAMNEVYGTYFTTNTPPARQTIQVSELPKGAPIEISCIAMSNEQKK